MTYKVPVVQGVHGNAMRLDYPHTSLFLYNIILESPHVLTMLQDNCNEGYQTYYSVLYKKTVQTAETSLS